MSEGMNAPAPIQSAPGRVKNIKGLPNYIVEVILAEPIEVRAKDDGEVIEIIDGFRFRRPNAGDLIEVGGPPLTMDVYAENPISTIQFDGKRMTAMMSRLSGVNQTYLSKMTTGDWMYTAYQISPFFYPIRAMTS